MVGDSLRFDVAADPEVGNLLRLEAMVEAAEAVPVHENLQEIGNLEHLSLRPLNWRHGLFSLTMVFH